MIKSDFTRYQRECRVIDEEKVNIQQIGRDSIIVGKFVGEDALAAVGTSNQLVTLVILFVSGLCMGAGVLISMQYGAKDYDKLCLQLSSTLIGGLVFSAAVAIVSVIAAPALLRTALPVPDH